MLPRHLRLKNPRDFTRLRQQGQRWRGRRLALNAMPNDLNHSRFGFVVSGRVGTAVVRNTVKRRLRSAIRQWLPELASGYDVVVVAYQQAAEATYHELEAELESLLARAGLLPANRTI